MGVMTPRRRDDRRTLRCAALVVATWISGAASCTCGSDPGGSGGQQSAGAGSTGGASAVSCPDASFAADAGPPACPPALPPYAGPLCGPADRPCRVVADETIEPCDETLTPLAIAADGECAPHVVLQGQNFAGVYAERTAARWRAGPIPFPVAAAGLAFGQDGAGYVLAYDGAFDMGFNRREGQAWTTLEPLPGANLLGGSADLVFDDQGVARGVAVTEFGPVVVGTFATATTKWSTTALADNNPWSAALTVGSDGSSQVVEVYGGVDSDPPSLRWRRGQTAPEIVVRSEGLDLDNSHFEPHIVVTPDPEVVFGRPRILFEEARDGLLVLKLAERGPGGVWSITPIDEEHPAKPTTCGTAATPGVVCHYDMDQLVPFGIVASRGGDVRVVYSLVHHVGDAVSGACATTDDEGDVECPSATFNDQTEGQITIAWRDAAGRIRKQKVGPNLEAAAGVAGLDPQGTLHVAVRETPDDPHVRPSVRYFALVP
jgi:hypothetical protein